MPKKSIIGFFLLLACGAFLAVRYVNLVQAKAVLETKLAQAQRQAGLLEAQLKQEQELRNRLNDEKEALSASLKEAQGAIAQLNEKNTQAQEHIFSLIKEVDVLEYKNSRIKEELNQLKEEINTLEAKNIQLEERLQSLPELKKAIREIKLKLRNSRRSQKPASKIMTRIRDNRVYFSDENPEGNSGFIVKDGIPTYKSRVKIEVKPLL